MPYGGSMRSKKSVLSLSIIIFILLFARAPLFARGDESDPDILLTPGTGLSDSLPITYTINAVNRPTDSIVLTLYQPYAFSKSEKIYPGPGQDSPHSHPRRIQNTGDRLIITGIINIATTREALSELRCRVTEYYTNEYGHPVKNMEYLDVMKVAPYRLLGFMEYPLPYTFYGIKRPAADKSGFLFSYAGGVIFEGTGFRFSVSSMWNGFGKHASFSEPLRIEPRLYTGDRMSAMPQLFAAGVYSRLRLKDGESEFRESEWGVSGGLAIETKFERFSYSYTSNNGGYHTLEAFFNVFEDGKKTGTKYAVCLGDDLWMVRISFLTESFTKSPGYRASLNNKERPLWHTMLAIGGFLPQYILLRLLCPGCGD